MSKFENSEWAEEKHAKEFMENADFYILERQTLFTILKSFYRHFLIHNDFKGPLHVLDLGCGDGAITTELLNENIEMEATLVDGSSAMLKNARENLKNYNGITFIQKTFQEILEEELAGIDILYDNFDFAVSSLAIHHLLTHEKKALFRYIYNHLNPGGFFLNIETVKAPSDELENWYRGLWGEWILKNQLNKGIQKNFDYLPQQYKNNPDNHPDTLDTQLNALKSVGFHQVDCYYKYGIFTIFGGKK
jgi:tRNA (cmo5U34)-methyltransferase